MLTTMLAVLVTLLPLGPDTCLARGEERQIELRADLGDFEAGMIAYQFFVQLDEGLIPSGETTVCDEVWCCNFCNGFTCRMTARPEIGPRVYALCHIGVGQSLNTALPCGVCGDSLCSGAYGDVQLATFWVQADPNYAWPPGESLPAVEFFPVGNPSNEGLFTCCAGQTGVECDACSGLCHYLPSKQGAGVTQRVCVATTGISDDLGTNESTWGQVKAGSE